MNAASVVSAGDIWTVAYAVNVKQTLIEHWDGMAWSIVPRPRPAVHDDVPAQSNHLRRLLLIRPKRGHQRIQRRLRRFLGACISAPIHASAVADSRLVLYLASEGIAPQEVAVRDVDGAQRNTQQVATYQHGERTTVTRRE